MERKIIAVLMATIFLVTMVFAAFPVQVSAYTGDPIYIGIIGPKGSTQWRGIWDGAKLAQKLINDAGGMKDSGGDTHELKLVQIDECSFPFPDPYLAVRKLRKALNKNPTMQFLIGGVRSECVLLMREFAMDYAAMHGRPIWIIAGASEDYLIDDGPASDNPFDDVREDYDRYKYMFRVNFNQTVLLRTLLGFLSGLAVPKLSVLFGSPLPTYIIAEDLAWVDPMLESLLESVPLIEINIVGVSRPSPLETDFGPFLDAIENSGAKLVIHLFSGPAGTDFIDQWGKRKVPAVPVGINVESQMEKLFWFGTGGGCEYETVIACGGTRTNINPNAKPLSTADFWDLYDATYGDPPVCVSFHAYDAIMMLNETAADWIGKTCDEIIPIMEQTEANTLLGYFKYTKYHDAYCDVFTDTPIWPPTGWPGVLKAPVGTVRPLVVQWQADRLAEYRGVYCGLFSMKPNRPSCDRREVVWPRGTYPAEGSVADGMGLTADSTPLPFAKKWKIPPQVYSLGETDFAGPINWPLPPVPVDGVPAGFFGYINLPDGFVDIHDSGVVTYMWQETCAWNWLEADMDGNNFIDIIDVIKVALDWGKMATPQDT